MAIPLDREIIHTLPQSYTVDTQEGVRMPVGMSASGWRQVHMVTAPSSPIPECREIVTGCGA